MQFSAATIHVEPQAGERSELGGVTTTPDERYSAGGSSVKQGAEWSVATPGRTALCSVPKFQRKKPTGESHLLPMFVFGKESEDGTDIYIILIYSRMLSIGY